MIAILDYKAGNLTSVKRAMNILNEKACITSDPEVIASAERVIFPGVGAAGSAMADLRRMGLDEALVRTYEMGKPLLGICLGMQIIMEHSHENNTRCLGLLKGEVKPFPGNLQDPDRDGKLKVPHMGWNSIRFLRDHILFEDVDPAGQFYFVHGYYPVPGDEDCIVAETTYGFPFASVLALNNLVAVQFHPEKSGRPGLKMLSNFCHWDGSNHA
ncbi:MAG: imidazole glycerol phosphate synthase subunit HisH [Desulfatiglandaceae bacterium]|jgi:imidazole glycerol-phosphate synthase subunit HisH